MYNWIILLYNGKYTLLSNYAPTQNKNENNHCFSLTVSEETTGVATGDTAGASLHTASHPPGGCPGLLHVAQFRQNHTGLLGPAEKAVEHEGKAQQSGQCFPSGLKPERHNGSLTEWSSSLREGGNCLHPISSCLCITVFNIIYTYTHTHTHTHTHTYHCI